MSMLESSTRAATMPPPPTPTVATRRPSRAGYAWAAVIAIAGVAVGVVWGATTYIGMQDRIDGFARASIPGETSVFVAEAGGRVVYYEGPGEMPLVALDVRVTSPSGDDVAVGTYGADLRYDAPGGQVGHAVGTFDAPVPGPYTVVSSGTAPPGSALAVGPSIPTSTFASIVAAVLLVLGSLAAAATLVVVTAVRRH